MAESSSLVGQTISHYRVLAKLGAGGMGVVYKAIDEQLQRTVALKFLPEHLTSNSTERDKLLQEARAASALDHPNIGVIYGLEEAGDGRYFISMGYYEGETLSDRLARGTPSLRDALDLAIQIAGGLAAAHAQNIVHRDIKPGNIILSKDHLPKIVDFGLARAMAATNATLTVNTSGTLPYMSPEQILGEPVDPRADVWALGVILVQLLTGTHPFYRDSSAAMTFAILNQAPAGTDEVPPGLQPIVYRALSKETTHRYPSGKEIQAELQAARAVISGPGSGSAGAHDSGRTRLATPSELKHAAQLASKPRWPGVASETGKSRKPWVIAALVLGALLASSVLYSERQRMGISRLFAGSVQQHIAVLPFENIGNEPSNEAVAQGLMDSLTNKLSNLDSGQQSLWVVPSSVVRNRNVSEPSAAARDLGATLVVMGSLQRSGDDVRLTVNLIDTNDLRQIGSASLEDHLGNIGTLQDEAVVRLAKLMNVRASPDMLRDASGEAAPAAYESYLKALGYMQRYDKPGNLDLAISSLSNAVAADSRFALGYASLGEAYRLKNQLDPNPKWIEQANVSLDRAVHLNDRLAGPYNSLGRLHTGQAQYDLALQEFQKAVTLNPRDPDVLVGMANVYEHMSRLPDAEATYRRAIALRPDYWDSYNSLGGFYDRQERYTDAVAQYKKVIDLTPDNATAYSNLGAEYMSIGDAASNKLAESAIKKSIQISPSYSGYANLGNFYLGLGRYDESAAMTRQALALNDKDYRVWCNLLLAERNRNNSEGIAGAKEARARTEELLVEHLKQQPQDATAMSWLAIFRSEEQQKEQALQLAESALTIAPKDPLVSQNIAETYENLGDRARALKYTQESLSNGNTLNDLQTRPALRNLLADKNFHASGKN
jgi:serine/threonine protein kinase/Flp pilus assembly protein TadD